MGAGARRAQDATVSTWRNFSWLLEGRNDAHQYVLLVEDVLLRRLVARRLLRSAFVVQAGSCEDVYDWIREYIPCDDGVVVVPFADQRFERNLRKPGVTR